LTCLAVSYLIENKEAAVTVTEVETGVRRRDDGREQRFEAFKAAALAPFEKTPVFGFVLAQEIFEGLTDPDYTSAFLFWAHFTAPDGRRWAVIYDPEGRSHDYVQL